MFIRTNNYPQDVNAYGERPMITQVHKMERNVYSIIE